MTARPPAAILDVDGTLVDSNYQHALAWYRAFREAGVVLPLSRLHRHVGMGGDKYVAAVAGDDVERRLGDQLRDRWQTLFDELLPEVEPFDGAYDLIARLRERGHRIVLASSAIQAHFNAFVDDRLGARELVNAWTTKDDVEASKPAPKARTLSSVSGKGVRPAQPGEATIDTRAGLWVGRACASEPCLRAAARDLARAAGNVGIDFVSAFKRLFCGLPLAARAFTLLFRRCLTLASRPHSLLRFLSQLARFPALLLEPPPTRVPGHCEQDRPKQDHSGDCNRHPQPSIHRVPPSTD